MSNNSKRANWDPSSFRLTSSGLAPPPVDTPRRRKAFTIAGMFIAGPVDVVWLLQARKLGVTALWVGLGLWFLRGLKKSDSFIVSNLLMQTWAVLPDAKSRALKKLERVGLITIEQRGKRSPRITLVVHRTQNIGLHSVRDTRNPVPPGETS